MTDIKILLVEDESIEALDIKRTLENLGYQVPYIVSGGEEAVEKATEIIPDLILMDIVLKGHTNGIEAASEIKKLNIPVIYLTAHSEESTIERAKLTSPAGYIIKPYDPMELKYAIELAIYKNQMEKELEKTRTDLINKLNEAQHVANVGSWDWDLETNEVWWSDETYNIFEVSKDFTPSFESNAQFIHPDDLETYQEEFKQSFKTGQALFFNVRILTDNGTIKNCLSQGKLVYNSYKEPKRFIGTIMDITESKKVENELRNVNEWLSFTQRASKSGFWDWDMKTEKLTWSPEFFELFGLPASIEPSFDIWLDILHSDDREPAMEKINKAIKDHEFLINEYRVLRPDGAEIWIRALGTTYYDENDQPIRMSGICLDITKIKLDEEQRRKVESQYKSLFESDPDYTILVGADGVLLDVNNAAANFMNLSKKELIGKNFAELELFPKEDLPYQIRKFNQALKGELVGPYQYRLINREGNFSWVESQLVPQMRDGEVYSIMIISSDITAKKAAIDELKSSIKEKEALLKEIHHRVKNNLQIISSLLNLQKQYSEDEKAEEVLKESQNRIKTMALLHEKLYQSEDLSNIKISVYVERLVKDVFSSYAVKVGLIKPILNIDDVTLNMETAVPCGLLISELVSNSLKHAFPEGKKGEIRVYLKKFNDEYELTVSDNGVGLPDDIDFQKTDSLGLQLINNLVSQIEGKIKLDRSQGAEFKIMFKELDYKERL